MNVSPIVEKTVRIMIDDADIKVSSLPEHIRFEVDTLDRYSQKKLDIIAELELIELAINAKRAHIKQLVLESNKSTDAKET